MGRQDRNFDTQRTESTACYDEDFTDCDYHDPIGGPYEYVYEPEAYYDSEEGPLPSRPLQESRPKRAKYNARMDAFLNNGIIIVGILLVIVLLVAFLV